MLLYKSLNISYGVITQLRVTKQVTTLNRQLSTLHRIGRRNVVVCYIQKCQNGLSIPGQKFTRHQSTQSISVTEATTTNVEKVIGEVTNNVASSSTPVDNILPTSNIVENLPAALPDVPTPVEQIAEAISIVGEPTLASLGLCNYSPVGLVQVCLEWLHVSQGLPWWTSIAVGTMVIRIAVFPLVIKAQRNAAKMAIHMPEIQYLQTKMTEARKMGDMYEASNYGQELMRYTKDNNINFFKSFMMPLIQAPIFISFFWALRQMINAPVESMKEGGLWWFMDLTVYDPYYILPLITSTTLAITVEIGTDSMSAKNMSGSMKYVMRAIPVVIFPFTMHFEGAILCYWVSTNFVSLVQTSILKIPKIRKYFDIISPPPKTKAQIKADKKPFVKGFKDSIKNFKIARDMRERENFDQMQFQRAGKGPLIKTYNHNPRNVNEHKAAILTKKRNI